MLEFMADKNIFEVELSKDKTEVTFTEGCDDYYDAIINKDQLLGLISDLQAIADQMA